MNREYILHAELTIKCLRPKVFVSLGVDELRVDPDVVANPLYGTFEYCFDAEFGSDLSQILGGISILHHGSTRDHFQSTDIGKAGEEVIVNAIGKQHIFRIGAAALERQYRNRQSVGARYRKLIRGTNTGHVQCDRDCQRDD